MIQSWISRVHERWDSFKQFIADVIYDRRGGIGVRIFGAFLRSLSYLFSGIVQLRYWLYEKRIFRKQFLGCLVVVVGNLTVGGTGKTPVVEKFARNLAERGRKVAILSRGYMSKREPFYKRWWRMLTHGDPEPPKVVSDGERVLLDSEVAGDEPYMLACNLPGVLVLVDRNRVKAGQYAIKKFGVDTLILDDGFQYLPLQGRLNLLLVDKTNPFGNGSLIPRGILREPLKHLRRASYVLLTKSDGQTDRELESLIRRHHPDVEIIECAHKPQYLQVVHGEGRLDLDVLKGKRIAALSAIAAPDSFERFLRSLGAQVVYNQRFLDHHRFTDAELNHFFEQCKENGVDYAITTEKDAVRIPATLKMDLPFYYLRLEIDILSGSEDFEAAVSRICFPQVPVRSRDTQHPFLVK